MPAVARSQQGPSGQAERALIPRQLDTLPHPRWGVEATLWPQSWGLRMPCTSRSPGTIILPSGVLQPCLPSHPGSSSCLRPCHSHLSLNPITPTSLHPRKPGVTHPQGLPTQELSRDTAPLTYYKKDLSRSFKPSRLSFQVGRAWLMQRPPMAQ